VSAGPSRRTGMLVPSVFVLAGVLTLLGLGTWQLERKAWKEGLIETLDRRQNAAPVELPPPGQWDSVMPEDLEFQRVRLRGEFLKADDAHAYTSGSALRDDVKGQGYFVFSPMRLPDGRQVVVNRGFAPDRSYPRRTGPEEIVGALRWPEAPSWFVADRDSTGIWFMRDQRRMAQAHGWGPVAPFYIEQEAPIPPGGVPHPAALKLRLRNDHLQYALTWFALAIVFAVMFAIWTARRLRDRQG